MCKWNTKFLQTFSLILAFGTVFLVRKNCGPDAGNIYALKVISKAQVVKEPKTVIHMKAERKVNFALTFATQ